MPGYRTLPESIIGTLANSTREAALFEQSGNITSALVAYEEALATVCVGAPLPGYLCGRLAALYRRLGRYDDEVALLQRYTDSQVADDARSRFQARLSKARAIQEKMRRRESGALTSVRSIKRNSGDIMGPGW